MTTEPTAAATPENGSERLVRGLKGIGIGLVIALIGIGVMVFMGSQGYTGNAAIGAALAVIVGIGYLLWGVILTIWGAIAKARGNG